MVSLVRTDTCTVLRTRDAQNRKGKKRLVGIFTQVGGLGGLALGYYLAAPSGRRTGELATWRK